MTQMGMQMPGRRRARAVSPNVYTGLLLAAVTSLLLANVFVVLAAMKVGPEGGAMSAFKIHESGKPVKLADKPGS